MQLNDPKVIVALDYNNEKDALNFVDRVDSTLCNLKVGKELFTIAGPQFVTKLVNKGFRVFLDLKFHDIPHTVQKACEAAASLGVWIADVHVSGGREMMESTVKALSSNNSAPKIIGVTVLTSMNDKTLNELGVNVSAKEQVKRLASLAYDCGLDGVVASANESTMIKEITAKDFLVVTPGIRPKGADIGDQSRIMTPYDAIKAQSDYLVIGRPITKALDPIEALKAIQAEIDSAL